jgi:hypothetical protein
MRRLIAVLALAVAAVGLTAGSAAAETCSGKTRPHDNRGTHQGTPIYTLQYGSAADPIAGYYYTDGYMLVDGNTARNGGNAEVRSFTPMNPMYADVHLVVGPNADRSCVHLRVAYLNWLDWVFGEAGQEAPPPPFAPIDIHVPPR